MSFPPALSAVLEALLDGVSRKDLAARTAAMSDGYRKGQTSQGIATQADALAYAVARMPATFAACAAVFGRLREVAPHFAPQSLLDVGAGTGAASWAAHAMWPGIAVTMLDRNPALRELAKRLAQDGDLKAQIIPGDIGAAMPASDLVVASYVLAEFPQDKVGLAATQLWQQAGLALVLIEPGTPQGFARIRTARAALIGTGAHVAAPCTHDNACPLAGEDWCHFSQRLPRSRAHMALKDAHVPFEDERYSYVVVTRDRIAHGARILAPPLEAKPGLTFKLCDENGLRAQFVAARDKEEYRRVKKRGWGDLF